MSRSPLLDAFEAVEDITALIDYLDTTEEDSWQLNTVRSADGAQNCFFGHLWNFAEMTASAHDHTEHRWANALWEAFEERWSTTYAVYPVNDGANPRYQQDTPKQRVIAYLKALRAGEEMTTMESMEAEAAREAAAEQTQHN